MSSQSSDSERKPLLHRNLSRGSDRSTCTINSYTTAPRSPRTVLPSPNIFCNQAPHRRFLKTWLARAAILLSLVFERIAFYGLAGNLVLFLNLAPYNWVSYFAVDASFYFLGLSLVTSLIGGWLADSVLGRFKTILISFFIYLAGYSCLPLLSNYKSPELPSICWDSNKINNANATSDTDNPFQEPCSGVIFIVLTVIAIGTGFIKANIAPFGSDQVARDGQQATLSFFNWFYWSINVGALVGLVVITAVQQEITFGFYYGFIASASCLGLSAVIFVAGRCCYHVRPPDGSVLSNIFRILCEAFRRKRLRRQQIMIKNVSHSYVRHGGIKDVDEADPETSISFLDYAKHCHGGIFHDALVDDVKKLKKIFVVFAVLIPYWICYFQMETTFMVQGLHMRLTNPFKWSMGINHTKLQTIVTESNSTNFTDLTHNPSFKVPPAWFSVFDVVVLIIFLPLADKVIYPFIERRRGSPVSITRRILLGMMFAMAAMICAGVLEYFRLKKFWPNPKESNSSCLNDTIFQKIDNSTIYQAADLTILLQIPQYVLLGLSEVFTSVAGLQFAVTVAPRSMKSIIMALFYLFSGIGSLLGTALISGLSSNYIFFDNTDHGNINCRFGCDGNYPSRPTNMSNYSEYKSCHLDFFFYLLAGVEFVGILLFLFIAQRFQLDEHHRQSRNLQHISEAATSDFMDPADTTPAAACYRPVRKKTTCSIHGYPSDVSS